ncbi:MAG: penicillin-binding protein, partial [Treponema sp.]|nr:penicillin-binding protein [Treponema sp.]
MNYSYEKKSPPGSANIRIRAIVFFIFLLVVSLTLLFRYGTIMLKPREAEPVSQAKRFAERGPILDRNGRILALQTRFGNISVWRPEIADPVLLSRELAPILDMPADEILDRIDHSPSDFIYLKKQVDQS